MQTIFRFFIVQELTHCASAAAPESPSASSAAPGAAGQQLPAGAAAQGGVGLVEAVPHVLVGVRATAPVGFFLPRTGRSIKRSETG